MNALNFLQNTLKNKVWFRSPEYFDYIFAEIEESLAMKIVEILSKNCTLAESKKILKRTYSLLLDSEFSFKSFTSETNTQQLSPDIYHPQSEEQTDSSCCGCGHSLADTPDFNRGQNIDNRNSMIDILSREIADIMLSTGITYYKAIGTLAYAKHLLNGAVLSRKRKKF
jgi:hypothetical protein